MSGNGQADEMDQLNLDYKVSVTIDKQHDTPHQLLLRIKLKRLTKRSFIEYVAPTGVLVIVSWVRSVIVFLARRWLLSPKTPSFEVVYV